MEDNRANNLPDVKISLDTSSDDLDKELYLPCLKWATKFDRGVGYFTTGWIKKNLFGMSDFASRGGTMRLITSPIITNADYEAIINSDNDASFSLFKYALLKNVETLAAEMEKDVFNAFAWMLHDGIIELRFALPTQKLEDGDFHDKFGVFEDDDGNALSFSGSINDSAKGFRNYESIKVFKTWNGTEEYVNADKMRFEKLWNRKDPNVVIYNVPQAVKDKIFTLRTNDRPYSQSQKDKDRWEHIDIAVNRFLEEKNGILAMATGTGKTATAKRIARILFYDNAIKRAVITMSGNDLLDQWAVQIRDDFPDKICYSHYGNHKDINQFVTHPDNSILLVSSDSSNLTKLLKLFDKLPTDFTKDTLFVFDEVHGIGSETRVDNLSGKFGEYLYRLGLSATPEREYDEEGNDFIESEVGPVIYTFGIKDAIEKGILCPFNYIPLTYELTEEEREKKKKIIAAFDYKRKQGEIVSDTEMYTALSLINKTATDKLNSFEELLNTNADILKKCIIFVQTREYGERVQDILIKKHFDFYHTYYAEDEKSNLERFAAGELECLLTCKKVSEGIDINSVENIVLFSSDRSKLVTTQRIGRALRSDRNNPNKIAKVIDFVQESEDDTTADNARKEWLTELSKIRRKTDEK